jgi:flavorubredoxin
MIKLSEKIYYTGVLNPNMRVFDVIMRTEFGTSYNSYVVKGSERTALFETAHARFFSDYEAKLKEALEGKEPDFLVVSHTEPDHSGSIARLLELYPKTVIYASKPAANYLKNILNRPAEIHAVSEGETLELGGLSLKFLIAPFLHWPDSMFTWIEGEKALAGCDFLGSHYCEPQILDSKIAYPASYEDAAKYYYDCIFAPFASHVRNGLAKIEGLDIRMALTGHGPVLTRGAYLEKVIGWYGEWSNPAERERPLIPIFYATAYGNTASIAQRVKLGINKALPDAECEAYDLSYESLEDMAALMNASDAFLLGSITINRGATPPIMQLLAMADTFNIAKRPAAVFGSYGWSGEGISQALDRLKSLRCSAAETPFRVQFVPTEKDLADAEGYGEAFAASLGI